METNNEFHGIGKKLPYRVPSDFFEQISEKTLHEAKQREKSKVKYITLWRFSVAASLIAAIVLIGYLLADQPTEIQIAVKHNEVPFVEPTGQEHVSPVIEIAKNGTSEKSNVQGSKTEPLGDLLTDLSDEELEQLAAMITTDPFMDESMQ